MGDFKVGVVPFLIWLEVPAEIKADLTFNSAAEATFGVNMDWKVGDAYVAWNPQTHWTDSKPTPELTFTPSLTTSASVDIDASFAVNPTLVAHFDSLLTYTLAARPLVTAEMKGSEASKQVCLTSSYDVDVEQTVELDINIPWANIAKDWKWSKPIFNSGTKPIENKCIPLAAGAAEVAQY